MKSPLTGERIEVNWCGPGPLSSGTSVGYKADWHLVRERDGTEYVASEGFRWHSRMLGIDDDSLSKLLDAAREANRRGSKLVFLMSEDRAVYEIFGLDPKVGSHEPFLVG